MKLLGTEEVVTSCWFSPDLHHKMLRKKKNWHSRRSQKESGQKEANRAGFSFRQFPLMGCPFCIKNDTSLFFRKKKVMNKNPLYIQMTPVFFQKKKGVLRYITLESPQFLISHD